MRVSLLADTYLLLTWPVTWKDIANRGEFTHSCRWIQLQYTNQGWPHPPDDRAANATTTHQEHGRNIRIFRSRSIPLLTSLRRKSASTCGATMFPLVLPSKQARSKCHKWGNQMPIKSKFFCSFESSWNVHKPNLTLIPCGNPKLLGQKKVKMYQ